MNSMFDLFFRSDFKLCLLARVLFELSEALDGRQGTMELSQKVRALRDFSLDLTQTR